MIKQNNNTLYLSIASIALISIIMLGSFVVSFNVLDILYLISFIIFLIIYRVNRRKKNN